MDRPPKKASPGKRAKKTKIRDLPAGTKARGVKGGDTLSLSSSTQLSSFSQINTTLFDQVAESPTPPPYPTSRT